MGIFIANAILCYCEKIIVMSTIIVDILLQMEGCELLNGLNNVKTNDLQTVCCFVLTAPGFVFDF